MAEGILAQLKVILGLDATKLHAGLDESAILAKKSAGKIQGEFRSLAGSIQRLFAPLGNIGGPIGTALSTIGTSAGEATRQLGSMGGTLALVGGVGAAAAASLAGGLFALAVKAADVGAKIFEAGAKTGISAAQMSGLMALTKQLGGNFDGLTNSLARAGANLAKLTEGSNKGSKELAAVGVNAGFVAAAHGNLGDKLQAVLAKIFATNDEWKRNAALSALLGRGWMENVSTLKALAEQGYAPAIEKARQLGVYFNDDAARQAKQFQVELRLLEGEATGLALTLGTKLLPAATKLLLVLVGIGPTISNVADKMFHWYNLFNPALAVEFFKAVRGSSKEATQAMTDFLTQTDALTRGFLKTSEGEGGKPGAGAGGMKAKIDALGALIEREKDELAELAIHGNKEREIQAEYDRTTREILKAVAAGGNYEESLRAQGLALDIYRAKMLDYIKSIPNVIPTPGVGAGMKPLTPPTLALPKTPDLGTIFAKPLPPGTLTQLEQLNVDTSKFRSVEEALNREYQLSYSSLEELKKIFGDLPPEEIAATREGQKWINALTRMEQQGKSLDFGSAFRGQLDAMIADGDKFAENLAQIFRGTVDDINSQLARLATGGKANWKEMRTGIEQKLIGAGLQKAEGTIISSIFGKSDMGGKPTGSRSQPFYVRLLDKMGSFPIHPATEDGGGNAGGGPGGLGGLTQSLSRLLRPTGASTGGVPTINGLADLSGALNPTGTEAAGGGSGIAQIFSQLGGSIWSGLKSLGGLFGGFLAEGGDVTPGKAYVVGERHPEFFIPRASGSVVPSVHTQQLRPLMYSPAYHISTPDADSFRRSHAQIVSEGYRAVASLHARSR